MVPPAAPPLAVLQAAMNAAADLSPRLACDFGVASKNVRDDMLSHVQVVPNRWSGAFSGQGFGTARQRAQRGVSLIVIHGAKRGG